MAHFVNNAHFSLAAAWPTVGLSPAPEIPGEKPIVPSKPLLLLTDPAHFEVTYTINPWMQPCAWAENPAGHLAAARHSFQSFAATLVTAGARLEIMPGVAGLP